MSRLGPATSLNYTCSSSLSLSLSLSRSLSLARALSLPVCVCLCVCVCVCVCVALALERYLKEIGIHEVWIRGHSEAKLLDADPAFHNFQV
jgi:hypothetical protein